MVLLYIWVQQFRNIVDQGFCLSSQLIVKGERGSSNSFHLHISANEDYLPFFYGSSIKDLKAIVAENGAGKSNLLDLIRNINGTQAGGTPFVAVYLTDENEIHIRSNFKHVDLKTAPQFSNLRYQAFGMPELEPSTNANTTLPMIFYSGIMDIGNSRHSEEYGDINISCAAELSSLAKDKRLSLDHIRQSIQNKHISFAASALARTIHQIRVPAYFTVKFVKQTFLGMMPKGDDRSNIGSCFFYIDKDLKEAEIKYKEFLQKGETEESILIARHCLKLRFLHTLIINLASSAYVNRKIIIDQYAEDDNTLEKHHNHLLQKGNLLKAKFNANVTEFNMNDIRTFIASQKNIPVKTALLYLDQMLTIIDIHSIPDEGLSTFRLPIAFINNVYHLEQDYLKGAINENTFGYAIEDTILLHWEEQSSGEKALFDLFARIFSVRDQIQKKLAESQAFLLLIDEGETTFHPQWQKNYLSLLLEFLGKCFPLCRIQIVLTTHSPFVLSDVLEQNLLFLARDPETQTCISIDNPLNHRKSFAANIHRLYSESFFIKGSHIGSFAESKLDLIIKRLNSNDEIPQEELKQIKNVIEQIGEDFIQTKLDQLLQARIPAEQALRDKIIKLQQKLTDLQRLNYDQDRRQTQTC